MQLGIRTKLVIAFALVVIGPIVSTFIMMNIMINKLDRDPEIVKFNSLNANFQKVIEAVEDNFHIIDDYEVMDSIIRPIIEEFDGRVRVMDSTASILYDSSELWHNAIEDTLAPDTSIFSLTKYSYSTDIKKGQKVVGRVIIDYDINIMPVDIARKVVYHFSGSYIFGLATLILFIVILSQTISRSVLVPLKELNKATESIAEGNLDFTIKYKKNDELGRLCRAFETMRDKLKKSIEQQIESERQRKEMIGIISHDLRTPISSIKGYVEALQDDIARDEAQFKRYLQVIKDKTDRLDSLIDDLFLFSQMDLGRLKMDFEIMDSRAMLEDMLHYISLDWEDSHLEIIKERPFASVKVKVDMKRISQVMDNIIQNASRYVASNGQIRVSAVKEKEELIISVKDNGMGIAQEDLPHIFDLFYRGEKSRSRNYGGSGLGLAICKSIIEDHGGRIWAESSPGQGTTISFSLPIVESSELD